MTRTRILSALRWLALAGLVALMWVSLRTGAQDSSPAGAPAYSPVREGSTPSGPTRRRAGLAGQGFDSPDGGNAERALALAVAKVAANEASLARVRPAEVALVWQTTEARASTSTARLAWLRAHSSCVLTDRERTEPELRGNCAWSRHLGDDDTRPDGWPEHLAWERYAPRWAQVRTLALRLVRGESTLRPCPRAPFTWGGHSDRAHAIAIGLVPLGCRSPITGEPTLNEGYALRRSE